MTEAPFVIHGAPEMPLIFHSFLQMLPTAPSRKHLPLGKQAYAPWFNFDIQNAASTPKTDFNFVSRC